MSFLTTTPRAIRAFVIGESYWKVRFANNKVLSELDTKTHLDALSREIRVRKVEWLEDVIGSGDLGNVREVQLVTPKGTAHITVTEPYTAFQFSRGTFAMLTGERIKNLQIIGVVTNKDTGECECAVWDVQTQELYTMINSVLDFKKWRPEVIDIGRLNIEALDLRGIG